MQNWRQRGWGSGNCCSVFGLRRNESPNPAFSRASRSPALRRLAKLAPRASARKQHSADRSKARELKQHALFLNGANAACGVASPATAEAASLRAGRQRPAQLCELRNRRTRKTGAKKPPDKTNNSLNPLRHYAASGPLNLHAPRWYKP